MIILFSKQTQVKAVSHQGCLNFFIFVPWKYGKLSKMLISGPKPGCLAPNKWSHMWLVCLGRVMTKLIPATHTQVLPAFVLSSSTLGGCSLLQASHGLNLEEWQPGLQVFKVPINCTSKHCWEWFCSKYQPCCLAFLSASGSAQAASSAYGDISIFGGQTGDVRICHRIRWATRKGHAAYLCAKSNLQVLINPGEV